jgi:uncharacterized protein
VKAEEKMGEDARRQADGRFRAAGVFLLALIVWMVGTSFAASTLFARGADTRTLYLISAGVELLLAIPAGAFVLIRRIKPAELFGSAKPGQIALAAGAGLLLVPVSVAVAMIWNMLVLLTGGNIQANAIPVPQTAAQFLAAFAAVGLAAPAVEEPLMRGLLLNAGAGVLPRNRAILLATAAFAFLHGSFLGLPSIFLGGLLLGVLVWRSGSLWPAIAAHITYNTSATALEALLNGSGYSSGAQAAPQAMELLAVAIVYLFIALPFAAALAAVLWVFWKRTPQHSWPLPQAMKVPFSRSWPWFAAFFLLLCYIAIDVLQVYGIIRVS